jgi:hypothetical protein
MPKRWSVANHEAANVTRIDVKVGGARDFEQWFLLSGDRHHDNPHCRQDLERKHLDQARERDAGIIDVGDLFCAMQGKFDRRASKEGVRPENQNDHYLDSLIDCAADFYGPYSDLFVMLAPGNHETAIQKRHEMLLTEHLCKALRASKRGSPVQRGGYSGWVWFNFRRGNSAHSVRLWYIHGYGGGGPVTRGVIQSANRQQAYIEGADITLSGHVHEAVYLETCKRYLDYAGHVKSRTCYTIQTPTYKEEYGAGEGGWHIETGKPPKPLGAWWLRFTWSRSRVHGERANIQLVRAE